MWDWATFLVGLLVGLLVLLLFLWLAYATRTWLFTYCPRTVNWCTSADYVDPGRALAGGANLEDILYLNSQGELVYRRQPRSLYCTPAFDQEVVVPQPQYCLFTTTDGRALVARQVQGDAYTTAEGFMVSAPANCRPGESLGVSLTSGKPLARWDPEVCSR